MNVMLANRRPPTADHDFTAHYLLFTVHYLLTH